MSSRSDSSTSIKNLSTTRREAVHRAQRLKKETMDGIWLACTRRAVLAEIVIQPAGRLVESKSIPPVSQLLHNLYRTRALIITIA